MKKKLIGSVLAIALFFTSCEKTKTYTVDATLNDEINYFIRKGLNNYYLWQQDVPDLADNRFANPGDLYLYFRQYSSPESVFENLLNRPTDRFSRIFNDYIAVENSKQGITLNNGMEFGLVENMDNSGNLFGYVRYVIPNSDADLKGITRGMLFNTTDGTQLNFSNYISLLFGNNTSYTIGFADYNNGNPTSNNTSQTLDKTEVQENSVGISKIITDGTQKIGYLMYNQFSAAFDGNLNAVFANFKSENINDLIIDLRYNSGGSVKSATYLGSMVTGQFNGELYSKEVWNEKVQATFNPNSFINNFTNQISNNDSNGNIVLNEAINSLELSRVYFIVTESTASASELVINSLSSYIDVKLIGTRTVGKQVGSITVYDSEDLRRNGPNLNQNHTYALQPLVLEIFNNDNKNKPDGFLPGTTLPGIELREDFNDLGILGERSDPLLDSTLIYIETNSKTNNTVKNTPPLKEIYNSKLATPTSDNMYVDLKK
jgi:carboxyl-terminal processing protease